MKKMFLMLLIATQVQCDMTFTDIFMCTTAVGIGTMSSYFSGIALKKKYPNGKKYVYPAIISVMAFSAYKVKNFKNKFHMPEVCSLFSLAFSTMFGVGFFVGDK